MNIPEAGNKGKADRKIQQRSQEAMWE